MHDHLLISVLLGVVISASSAAAQDESAIPAPDHIDDASVSEWLSTYILTDGWTEIAADGVAVALGSAAGVAVRADGFLQADIRHEYYRPTKIGPYESSSNLQTRIIDCATRRQRVVEMTLFRDNNLREILATRASDTAAWTAPTENSVGYRVIDRVCRAPTEGEPKD